MTAESQNLAASSLLPSPVMMTVLAMVVALVIYLVSMLVDQYKYISHYESQGAYVYPGSRRPFVGIMEEFQAYMRARASETEIVEVDIKWYMDNLYRFLDAKAKKQMDLSNGKSFWHPLVITYLFRDKDVIISDPEVIQDLLDRSGEKLMDKNSFIGNFIVTKRIQDNVFTGRRSTTQIKRRRAFTNAFSGAANFKILDKTLELTLSRYHKKWMELQASGKPELNLRDEIIQIFKETMILYIYGRDVNDIMIKQRVLQKDGSHKDMELNLFDAHFNSIDSAFAAVDQRMIFGDSRMTESLRISQDNQNNLADAIDKLVIQQLKEYDSVSKDQQKQPNNFLDLLIMSEVYEGNVQRITGDLVISILAANDTSRNTSIVTLCQLAKDAASRDKVRAEISNCLSKHKMSSEFEIGYKQTNTSVFDYLNTVIQETMRFRPAVTTSESYLLDRDCKLGKYNFLKGNNIYFNIQGLHHDPNQWQQPDKFLPERFDPTSELYKTPNGKPRHPQSFLPFGFGERKCAGYTFAKVIIPSLIAKIIHKFNFELLDETLLDADVFPVATLFQNHQSKIMVKVTPVQI